MGQFWVFYSPVFKPKTLYEGFSDFLNKISNYKALPSHFHFQAQTVLFPAGTACHIFCPELGIAVAHLTALHTGVSPPHMAQGKVIPGDAQTAVVSPWSFCQPPLLSPTKGQKATGMACSNVG